MELMEDGTTIEQQMFAMAAEKKVPLYGVLELLPLCKQGFIRWNILIRQREHRLR